jgi:hypothetical protein
MSSLIGVTTDRWSLPRAVDALAESARQAGRPGMVWIVGLLYPSVTFLVGGLWLYFLSDWSAAGGHVGAHIVKNLLWLMCFVPVGGFMLLPFLRLGVGLARSGSARAWSEACAGRRTPRLRTLWKSGSGMTLSALGLWIQLCVMFVGALVVILLPAQTAAHHLVGRDVGWMRMGLGALVLGPLTLFFFSYALAVVVLSQLALHSLAQNRRGVGSALLHGWRIMRHDVWATARAVLVDFVLSVSVLILWSLVSELFGDETLSDIVLVLLLGFAGVTSAGYWARAYRALGGLSPDDGVPGLRAP